MNAYDPDANSKGCFDLAVSSLRERLEKSRVVIGDCTLYNEDCRFVLPTLHAVDLVASDPPYGIAYTSSFRRVSDAPAMLANDDVAPLDTVAMMMRPLRDGGAIYLCTRFDVSGQWVAAVQDAGGSVKTAIIWDKLNHTAGDLDGDYGCQTEIVLFAHKGRHKLRDGRDVNLWRIPRPPFSDHPTPKPVDLMGRIIRNSSDFGDTVLDPFMGSGATGVACAKLGRKFIGIELERKYFDITCRRIEEAYKQPDMFVSPISKTARREMEAAAQCGLDLS